MLQTGSRLHAVDVELSLGVVMKPVLRTNCGAVVECGHGALRLLRTDITLLVTDWEHFACYGQAALRVLRTDWLLFIALCVSFLVSFVHVRVIDILFNEEQGQDLPRTKLIYKCEVECL